MSQAPTQGRCAKCGQDVFVQIAKSGNRYYTNTVSRGDWHSKTCTGSKSEPTLEPTPEPSKKQDPPTLIQGTQDSPSNDFETADQTLVFDRTFKLVRITLSKSRKVSEQTMPQLPQFETKDYAIETEIECELGTDFPRVVREHFTKIETAINLEIQQDIVRMIPED